MAGHGRKKITSVVHGSNKKPPRLSKRGFFTTRSRMAGRLLHTQLLKHEGIHFRGFLEALEATGFAAMTGFHIDAKQ